MKEFINFYKELKEADTKFRMERLVASLLGFIMIVVYIVFVFHILGIVRF